MRILWYSPFVQDTIKRYFDRVTEIIVFYMGYWDQVLSSQGTLNCAPKWRPVAITADNKGWAIQLCKDQWLYSVPKCRIIGNGIRRCVYLNNTTVMHRDAIIWVTWQLVKSTCRGTVYIRVRGFQVTDQWRHGSSFAKRYSVVTPSTTSVTKWKKR